MRGARRAGRHREDAGATQRDLELGRHRFPPTARLVMAIVNRTPDSFYDRGATWDESAALDRVHAVVADGAEIVDIGGVKAGARRGGQRDRGDPAHGRRSSPRSAPPTPTS